MPELPEVETVMQGLIPVMEGQRIVRVDIRRPDLRWPFPVDMQARLEGQRVTRFQRRAKYILAGLESGETLLIHLGMSGRMLIFGGVIGDHHHDLPVPEKHDHVVLDMESGARITFNDARRFGAMDLFRDAHPLLAALGPEPFGNSFNAQYLATRLAGRNMPIKAALLDQRIVAGLGNIYVCEALWRSGISPTRAAGRIGARRIETLVSDIRAVLQEAIASGGSSLRDHRKTNGELGYFQHNFAAYDREGKPCHKEDCTGTIKRIVQSGRSSFYCPKCQR